MDWVAIPVSGQCELIQADLTPAGSSDSPHVGGWLSYAGEVIEVLNLNALMPASHLTTPGEGNMVPEAQEQ